MTTEHGNFDSEGEAKRYRDLLLLERAGQIANLRRQVKFPFVFNGQEICTYVADFVYEEGGRQVVEDFKGFRTEMYKLKRKMMRVFYGVQILETG